MPAIGSAPRRAASLLMLAVLAYLPGGSAQARTRDTAGTVLITKGPIDILPSQFRYSTKTLGRLEDEARAGNREAAYKVMQYYYRYVDSIDDKIYWARVAARSGDLQAMEMLATLLRERGGRGDCRTAIDWLERAMTSSDDAAFVGGARSFKKEILADISCGW